MHLHSASKWFHSGLREGVNLSEIYLFLFIFLDKPSFILYTERESYRQKDASRALRQGAHIDFVSLFYG